MTFQTGLMGQWSDDLEPLVEHGYVLGIGAVAMPGDVIVEPRQQAGFRIRRKAPVEGSTEAEGLTLTRLSSPPVEGNGLLASPTPGRATFSAIQPMTIAAIRTTGASKSALAGRTAIGAEPARWAAKSATPSVRPLSRCDPRAVNVAVLPLRVNSRTVAVTSTSPVRAWAHTRAARLTAEPT